MVWDLLKVVCVCVVMCDLHKGGVYGVGCVTYIRMVLCGLCDLHKGGVYGVGWSPT